MQRMIALGLFGLLSCTLSVGCQGEMGYGKLPGQGPDGTSNNSSTNNMTQNGQTTPTGGLLNNQMGDGPPTFAGRS